MPAYNFKQQFAAMVESGDKLQTIRAERRDGNVPKVGQIAYLYTGMRTANCRKLGEGEIFIVEPISIIPNGSMLKDHDIVMPEDRECLAHADGFDNYADMLTFFNDTHGLPFHGHLIVWELQK